MGNDVKNEDYVKSNPDHPVDGYDKAHGKYKDEPSDTGDTAAAAMPMAKTPEPFKNVKGGK